MAPRPGPALSALIEPLQPTMFAEAAEAQSALFSELVPSWKLLENMGKNFRDPLPASLITRSIARLLAGRSLSLHRRKFQELPRRLPRFGAAVPRLPKQYRDCLGISTRVAMAIPFSAACTRNVSTLALMILQIYLFKRHGQSAGDNARGIQEI
jgi:hypothetical protein